MHNGHRTIGLRQNNIFPVLKTVHNMIFSVFRLCDYKN